MDFTNTRQQYAGFDPETALHLRASEAERLREGAKLLITEGFEQLREANRRVVKDLDLAAALRASGEGDWRNAPAMREQSELLERAFKTRVRSPGSSFFIPEYLCGQRTLTVAGDGAGSVSTAVEFVPSGVPGASNSFLPLCTVVRPDGPRGDVQVGRIDALPTVTVLASETAQVAESEPVLSASVMAPSNLATYIQASKQWALQSRGGAAALQRLILSALRNKAQQQIIEGTGTNGEVTGLVTDSAVPGAAGTTLAMSHVTTALDAVEVNAGDGALTWVVTAAAAKILRVRPVTASGTVPIMGSDGKIGGYPVIVIGGTTSAHAVLGKWSDVVIHEWSPLELSTNPFAIFRADVIGIRGWISFNAAPLVNGSFYKISSIT